jgi:shikimate dehydrogenase
VFSKVGYVIAPREFFMSTAMSQITGTTRILGVIGDPIAHSLSPIIHNAAIAHLGLDCVYVAFPVAPADLATALDGFAAIDLIGCSVTIPHKQAIMPLLTQISPLAEAVGAVNTIRKTPNGWEGTNTDVAGFISPLVAMERDWAQTRAVILGNGGAARAVVAGCHQLGCGEICVVGRDAAKLAQFQHSWQEIKLATTHSNIALPVNVKTYKWDELPTLIGEENLLLINSTPIGMHPQVESSPVSAETIQGLRSSAIAYDLIYTPSPTKFLELATAWGAIAIDGVAMLVNQGAVAFEWWLQQPAPVNIMLTALIDRLKQ